MEPTAARERVMELAPSLAPRKDPTLVRSAGLIVGLPNHRDLIHTPLLRPPVVTVLRAGVVVPANEYCVGERFTNTEPAQQMVDGDRLERLFDSGAAIKFNRMELWSEPLRDLAAAFARAFGRQVKVWGFASGRGDHMVPIHRDPAEVVACQVVGTKVWKLGGPSPSDRWTAMEVPAVETVTTMRLEPDDLLYLPYGHAHHAIADSDSSFHIAFALEGTMVGEFRHRIVKHLLDGLDGKDSRAVTPENLPGLLDEISTALDQLATAVRSIPNRDATSIFSGRTETDLAELLVTGVPPEDHNRE